MTLKTNLCISNLETVNLKLRIKSDELKKNLEKINFNQTRYRELQAINKSELSLEESIEMIIYKNIEIETRKSHESGLLQTQLHAKVNQLNELLSKSQDQTASLREENERLTLENKVNKNDLEDVREDVKKMDMLNVILKRKLQNKDKNEEKNSQGEDSFVNSNFIELQNSCRKLSEKNEAGFSRLTYLSQVFFGD